MANVPDTTSPCPACNCTDSPLSITSSLTGIITFALVIWASVVYCYRSFRDFELEMREMQYRVQLAFEETARIRRAFIKTQRFTPLRFSEPGDDDTAAHILNGTQAKFPSLIDEAWSRTEKEMITAAKFVDKRLLKPITVLGILGSRTAYVMERERAAETMARLDRALENVKGIAANVSGQTSTETGLRIVNMEADIAELRRQNQALCELVKQILWKVTVPDLRSQDLHMEFMHISEPQ